MSRREELVELLDSALSGGLALLVVGSMFAGLGVLGYQIISWLKTGEWIPFPVWKFFELMGSELSFIPEIEWRGLQKIVLWLVELPSSIALPVSGLLLTLGLAFLFYPIIESVRPPPKPWRGRSETD